MGKRWEREEECPRALLFHGSGTVPETPRSNQTNLTTHQCGTWHLSVSMPSTHLENMSTKCNNVNMTGVKWSPNRPFNDLPALPPAVDLETKAVLKRCITARAALAELKQAAELIPNQAMLINTLPLLEARASSEIENIVTTADRLFRHLDADTDADPATREALRYRQALLDGFRQINQRPLNTRTAETVCTRIRGVEMTVRRVPGTALVNDRTGEVIYTPPEGEREIRNLLANWERFLNTETSIDPLVRMAAAHYQFEAIHPFADGNGRTGRVLNSLFLIQEDLLTLPDPLPEPVHHRPQVRLLPTPPGRDPNRCLAAVAAVHARGR
jgi:hypothetical protein